ncbi:31232_t:CDS:2, partial [Gigaspora margarita]
VQEECGGTIDQVIKKFRNMITTWIINCQRPLSIIEDPKLVKILQYLNPMVELVKGDAIKNTIMSLYNSGKQELKVFLSNINSKISFTSDLWMSPNNKGFIAVTAHYIDDNWALQEVIIDFGLMSGKHDGTNIANGFFKVLENCDITSKILAITLDNDADLQQYAILHSQWSTLEKIVEFLGPFKELTAIMSSSSNSTAYLIIPLFNIILNHIEDTAQMLKQKSKMNLVDEDFEEDETSFDEIDRYISEKLAIKETDVLIWWK